MTIILISRICLHFFDSSHSVDTFFAINVSGSYIVGLFLYWYAKLKFFVCLKNLEFFEVFDVNVPAGHPKASWDKKSWKRTSTFCYWIENPPWLRVRVSATDSQNGVTCGNSTKRCASYVSMMGDSPFVHFVHCRAFFSLCSTRVHCKPAFGHERDLERAIYHSRTFHRGGGQPQIAGYEVTPRATRNCKFHWISISRHFPTKIRHQMTNSIRTNYSNFLCLFSISIFQIFINYMLLVSSGNIPFPCFHGTSRETIGQHSHFFLNFSATKVKRNDKNKTFNWFFSCSASPEWRCGHPTEYRHRLRLLNSRNSPRRASAARLSTFILPICFYFSCEVCSFNYSLTFQHFTKITWVNELTLVMQLAVQFNMNSDYSIHVCTMRFTLSVFPSTPSI